MVALQTKKGLIHVNILINLFFVSDVDNTTPQYWIILQHFQFELIFEESFHRVESVQSKVFCIKPHGINLFHT